MFNKIMGLCDGKHITEMDLAAVLFPDPLVYKVVAVRSIAYIISCSYEVGKT